jgi:hypothetical protein
MLHSRIMSRPDRIAFIFAMVAAQAGSPQSVWTDPATGLTWTKQDNGSAVNRNAARSYCAGLTLGGLSGWKLPEIDQMRRLYDTKSTKTFALVGMHFDYHIKGDIELTGWHWSNTSVSANETAKEFESVQQLGGPVPKGQQFPIDVLVSSNKRALCVQD